MRLAKKIKGIALAAAAAIFSLALCFAILAWTEPGATPPDGNVAAPINTSNYAQTKAGNFTIGTGLTITKAGDSFALAANDGEHTGNKLTVNQDGNVIAAAKLTSNDKICFGASCADQWTVGGCPGDGNYIKGVDETTGEVICSGAIPTPPPACTNECTAADIKCLNTVTTQGCKDINGDGCTELTSTACSSGYECSGGACILLLHSSDPEPCYPDGKDYCLGATCGWASDNCGNTVNCGGDCGTGSCCTSGSCHSCCSSVSCTCPGCSSPCVDNCGNDVSWCRPISDPGCVLSNGSSCSSSYQCWSGSCAGGICVQSSCQSAGSLCSGVNWVCCSGVCSGGRCL